MTHQPQWILKAILCRAQLQSVTSQNEKLKFYKTEFVGKI